MKNYGKFKISNVGMIFTIIIFILSGVFYYTCSYYINIDNLQLTPNNIEQIAKLETIKDVLLVVISICGTNLLLSALIEVRTQNAFLAEIMNNDVIASPDFYENMSSENKQKVYQALESNLNSTIADKMFSNIKHKLNTLMHDYYFDSCEYFVTCDVCDNYIEKEITKKVYIKSYGKSFTIKDFGVGNVSLKPINGLDTFELLSVNINGKDIHIGSKIDKVPGKTSNLQEHNEYDTCETYVYKEPLKISDSQATVITVKCRTRTVKEDKMSTFKVTKPCRNFTLNYSLNQSDKYRLAVEAFGFLDDADDSTNNSSKSHVNIRFKDWIFKYDGVVVMILDK